MGTLRTDDLLDEAARNGVRVRQADLGERWGHYDDDARCITLNVTMTDPQVRSTLAHELDHAWHRDRTVHDPDEHRRRERRADATAARRLISPIEYAIAERMVGPDPRALADELDVAPWVIEVFQREADIGRKWTRA
ncbi:protein of unknown function [Micrococcales bacterium KH10]|nr:protein of unknown function [Micrococcales bacterium KH10]